jgi:arylsulfatase A-like enzyme
VLPNVLLVVLDTARADALEPYGAPPGSTPAIADLARRGRALQGVHAPACWTLPSHASMFTGLLPRATGILDLPEGSPLAGREILATHRDRFLPHVLRAHGYETRALSTNLWVTIESGFGLGFDEFRYIGSGRQAHLDRRAIRDRARWAREALRAKADDGAGEAADTIRLWLDRKGSKPFFWFVNLVECHSPYLPPWPYNDLGPIDRLRAAEDARRHLTLSGIWKACAGNFDVSPGALERMRHLYARSVRLMDDWLRDLLAELDRRGLLEGTLVVVTSDHGENFGDGGLMGHAFSLDQRLIRVPLVIAGPGALPDEAPIVSLASLPRMIARAIGFDAHPWGDGLPPDGVAVAQFEPPAPAEDPRWAPAFEEWGVDPATAGERVGRQLIAATDGRRKLQLRGGREELFDLEADPLELDPRRPVEADRDALVSLRAALDHPASTATAPGRPGGPPEISEHERAELENRMRLLGYM